MLRIGTGYCCERAVGTGRTICEECSNLYGHMTSNFATCPKCNGSGRRPVPADYPRAHIKHTATYDPATDTFACDNCGGQTMSLQATGVTRVDPVTGLGCLHEYRGQKAGNCYYVHTCTKCGDRYDIDSGD